MRTDPLTNIFTQNYQIPIKRGQFFKQKKFDIEYLGLTFYQRVTTFALVCIIASLFLIYSFMNIMFIIIKPSKFVFPYALSLFLFFNSLGLIFGFKSYYGTLMKKKRNYTMMFMCTTLVSLYITIRGYGYVMCLLTVMCQVASFVVFAVSFVPGGSEGLGSLANMLIKR